jgi:hypothetical protein
MKQWFFVSCLLVFVTALLSTRPKHGGEPSTPDFPLWTGGPSSNLRRSEWYCYLDFEIGYPLQSVSLLLDTGSSDIWISGPEVCHNCTFKTCENLPNCAFLFPTNGPQTTFLPQIQMY